MSDICKQVEDYYKDLYQRIIDLKKEAENAPEGFLRIRMRNGNRFYYFRTADHGSRSERYIPETDKDTVAALAEKRFIRTVLPALKQNLRAAERFLSMHSGQEEDALAESVPIDILELAAGIYVTPEARRKEWLAQTWEERPDFETRPQFRTLRGEYVRSKSEAFIADALLRHDLPYLYEKPLFLDGPRHPLFPDFTIYDPRTDKEFYWEHFGMMEDPAYAERTCRKLSCYLNAGLAQGRGLICTFETRQFPLSSADIAAMLATAFIS